MTTTPQPVDLLREKRQELGLPDPGAVTAQSRQWLLQGVGIGAALIGVSLGLAVLVVLRAMMLTAQIERLSTVEGEERLLKTQLTAAKTKLNKVNKANQDLVKGLVAVRSGSAVLRDLQTRVPEGIQLIQVTEEANGYRLKGLVSDPSAFTKVNAFQLLLKRSPLLDPNAVAMVKACRNEVGKADLECLKKPQKAEDKAIPLGTSVAFEMFVKFRPAISPLAEKQILSQLGADGLVRRLDLLQKEGLF